MTEQAAKALADVLGGDTTFPMPGSRSWGVTLERPDGQITVSRNVGSLLNIIIAALRSFPL